MHLTLIQTTEAKSKPVINNLLVKGGKAGNRIS